MTHQTKEAPVDGGGLDMALTALEDAINEPWRVGGEESPELRNYRHALYPKFVAVWQALKAIAPQPNGGSAGRVAEPVAWRVKDFADGWVLYDSKFHAEFAAVAAGALMEPLYAHPQSGRVAELEGALKGLLDACEVADSLGELYDEISGDLLDAARNALAGRPTPPTIDVNEAAILLWNRLTPGHHERWADEPHKAEYIDAASAILALNKEGAAG